MDRESKSGSGLPANGIVAVVLLAAGALFVREAPLETTRLAANEPRLESQYSHQDVDARLWQDPFGAIARHRAEMRKNDVDRYKLEPSLHAQAAVVDDLGRAGKAAGKPPQVLAVMLPGGPYSENIELRRRARYAVLAALNVSRLSPRDTEHLGYFLPAWSTESAARAPVPIPYEWFQPASDTMARGPAKSSLQSPVLVLWLQAEALGEAPLARMAELAGPFVKAGAQWRVLGPSGSDGLKDMIDEAATQVCRAAGDRPAMRFYSPYATVPDATLLADLKDKDDQPLKDGTVSAFFHSRKLSLVRTIGDDSRLADALIAELKLRGLQPRPLGKADEDAYRHTCATREHDDAPSAIAVVAEWDTLYGRSLRREFRAKENEPGFCVERFNYVRGLDGLLPADSEGKSGSSSGNKQGGGDKDSAHRKDGTFSEIAEGQSQYDYLRRLAVQMRIKDAEMRRRSADHQGFRAIGVLGNDVHDKLLVMQALRSEFPDILFFTTDMDARMLHPRERDWARNLIVASNFGLRLNDSVQGGVPPFRDSYQVSAFLSTRIAMDDARRVVQQGDAGAGLSQASIDAWFRQPRVFEIGRTAAFDFTGHEPREGGRGELVDKCRGREWIRCEDIHPAGSARYPVLRLAVLFFVFSLLVLALWLPPLAVSRGAQAWIGTFLKADADGRLRPRRVALLLLAVGVLHGVLPLALARAWPHFADWVTRDGKPMVLIEGISLWPTEALRIGALLLCIYLLFRAWLMLARNLEEIGQDFAASVARTDMDGRQQSADQQQRWWRKQAQKFSMRAIPPLHQRGRASAGHGMAAEAVDFWGRHIVQNRLSARLVRTGASVVVAAVLSLLVLAAINEPRFVPQRGELSVAVHETLRYAAFVAMYLLVFFVVDATVLSVRFARGLLRLRQAGEQALNWPDTTLDKFEQQLGMPRSHLGNWIDLKFIAQRTACVTQMIYYPFIVISLWLLSRSSVFDHWTMSMGTVLPAALGAAIALGCAVALRLAAEASRTHALEQIGNEISQAQSSSNRGSGAPPAEPTVEQLKLMQARIEHLHEGAFAPFWQQPLLKAVLLPFATMGGSTLLDYMTLANL